jgi:hypothetical protein
MAQHYEQQKVNRLVRPSSHRVAMRSVHKKVRLNNHQVARGLDLNLAL